MLREIQVDQLILILTHKACQLPPCSLGYRPVCRLCCMIAIARNTCQSPFHDTDQPFPCSWALRLGSFGGPGDFGPEHRLKREALARL